MKSIKLSCRTRLRRAFVGGPTPSSFSQSTWKKAEWAQRQEAAKKAGNSSLRFPPSAQLRRALEDSIKRQFGFEVEAVPSAATKIIRRIADASVGIRCCREAALLTNSQGG